MMRKEEVMKKWILIGVAAVIAVVIIAVVFFVSNLGPIIKGAVNKYGPEITKTALKVDDVGISIFSGQASLKGFLLGNPKGFKSSEAVKVKSFRIDVDKGSLTKSTIIINRVEILKPDITYEKVKGGDNFQSIIQNVQHGIAGDNAAKDKSGDKKPSKKMVIKDLYIKQGTVTLIQQVLLGDKGVTVPLPDIHLKNVGGEKDGISPAKVAEEVMKSLYSKITSPAVTEALNQQVKSVTGGVTKQVETLGGGKLKGIFGK
jgi:uncharacterized protein involved in outer membrane biogenesis